MWATEQPNCSNWEPFELKKLKHKLAHLSCNCSSCQRFKTSSTVILQNDKHVQTQQPSDVLSDQFTQVNPGSISKDHYQFMNTITKDVLCPSCFVTMNLLRGGVLRVLKDEESEIKPVMFCCDKATGKRVHAIEKSTSITNKLTPIQNISNLTLCDFISECSSDMFEHLPDQEPKRHSHQVKFVDTVDVSEKEEIPFNGTCFCVDNFVDSIRPPLVDTFHMRQ